MPTQSPNILLILTDQQRWDSLGCYGVPGVHTPNLDTLAAAGSRYDHCYVNNPICTPSRASLWTGKHLTGHGVNCLHDVMPEDETLFSRRLQQLGYDTALFGKLHISGHLAETNRRHPDDGFRLYEWTCDPLGFAGCDTAYLHWLDTVNPQLAHNLRHDVAAVGHIPEEHHLTTWAATRTIDYLTHERQEDVPFFCCMSLFDPHNPYHNHPQVMEDLIDSAALPPIVAADEPFDDRPYAHTLERRYTYMNGTYGDYSAQTLRDMRLGYHAAIALIDRQVGRVLRTLEDQGLAEDTLVIFTSDHGDMLGDHGLLAKGCFFYDACTRVPLLIRSPWQEPGQVIPELCQWHDIGATLLHAAGADRAQIRAWMPDACDLLNRQELADRGHAACLFRNTGVCMDREAGTKGYFSPPLHATMWREGPWKLNLYHTHNATGPAGELFHLEEDPHELHNLWDTPAYATTRQQLTDKLTHWLVAQQFQGRGRGPQALPANFQA